MIYYFQATFYISYIWRPRWILWGQRLKSHERPLWKLTFLMSPIMCNIQCLHPLVCFVFAMWFNDLLRLDADTKDCRPEVLEFCHTCARKVLEFYLGTFVLTLYSIVACSIHVCNQEKLYLMKLCQAAASHSVDGCSSFTGFPRGPYFLEKSLHLNIGP